MRFVSLHPDEKGSLEFKFPEESLAVFVISIKPPANFFNQAGAEKGYKPLTCVGFAGVKVECDDFRGRGSVGAEVREDEKVEIVHSLGYIFVS